MKEQKPGESFKVVDRRLFTAEGELREDAREKERREKEAAKSAPKPDSSKPVDASAAPASDAASASGTTSATEPKQSSQAFQLLVDLLARNAAVYLGGVADPRTGQAFVDLEGAREVIDMMDALREKTQGNLSAEDEQLLLDVIGSLKLSFMEVSRAAAAMQGKSKTKG